MAITVVSLIGLVLFELLPQVLWGRSPGKRAMDLRVVGPDGGRPGAARVIVRTLCWAAPLALFGYFWATSGPGNSSVWPFAGMIVTLVLIPGAMSWTDDRRGYHDYLAGTSVVCAPRHERAEDAPLTVTHWPSMSRVAGRYTLRHRIERMDEESHDL